MRMPVIGAAIGGLALGAIVVAGSRYVASPVQASIPAPSLGSTQLVSQGAGLASNPMNAAPAYDVARAYPASVSRPAADGAPAPARTRTVASRQPVSYRTVSSEPVKTGRSWKKSALIIGGSTAGGAGLGAIVGGKGGAAKGAVIGGIAGTVYDIATRNK